MKTYRSGPCCNRSSFEPMTAAAAVVVERRADRNRTAEDEERRKIKNKPLWPGRMDVADCFFAVAVADIGSAQARVVKPACVMQQHWNQADERDACTFAARARGVAR